jgi:four helix bundle protein
MRKQIEARCELFSKNVFHVAKALRKQPDGRTAADQLLDAATSTAANYRAAGRGRTDREFTAKLGVANEEVDECVYWLDFAADTGLSAGPALQTLRAEARELRAIISSSYATAKRNLEAKEAERKRRRKKRS